MIVIDRLSSKIGYKINTMKEDVGCPIIIDDKIMGLHCGGNLNEIMNVGNLMIFKTIMKINYLGSMLVEWFQLPINICEKHVIN